MDHPFGTRRRVRGLAINITPLIDVLLLLLIFVMMSSTFRSRPGFDVQLPEAAAAETQEQDDDLELTIDESGAYFLSEGPGGKLSIELLTGLLQAEARDAGGDPGALVIRADERVPYAAIMHALDIAYGAGFRDIALPTRPVGDDGGGS